ncbi:hypothetical protein FOA52_006982 [Chlamydomonas sp. UWO 241]|nr:hypothetical protein FOA52_006982 [Chlamydomonas sp. UWO 241]
MSAPLCMVALVALVACMCMCMCMGAHGAQGVHILALGDSLTEGMTRRSATNPTGFHPYATRLQELLNTHHLPRVVEVTQKGVSAERVLATMRRRLERELQGTQDAGFAYVWVLLLAGINDIGAAQHADKIWNDGLLPMYLDVMRHGAKLLAMTCMQTRASEIAARADVDVEGPRAYAYEQHRQALNVHIRAYCSSHSGGCVLLDLDKLVPYVNISAAQRAEMWDDGIHLTPHGYDHVADLLNVALARYLHGDRRVGAPLASTAAEA